MSQSHRPYAPLGTVTPRANRQLPAEDFPRHERKKIIALQDHLAYLDSTTRANQGAARLLASAIRWTLRDVLGIAETPASPFDAAPEGGASRDWVPGERYGHPARRPDGAGPSSSSNGGGK